MRGDRLRAGVPRSGRAGRRDPTRSVGRAPRRPARRSPRCSRPDGVRARLEAAGGDTAVLESRVERFGDGTFVEDGTITYGRAGAVTFETIGRGWVAPAPVTGWVHGGVMWTITGGDRAPGRRSRAHHVELHGERRRRGGRRPLRPAVPAGGVTRSSVRDDHCPSREQALRRRRGPRRCVARRRARHHPRLAGLQRLRQVDAAAHHARPRRRRRGRGVHRRHPGDARDAARPRGPDGLRGAGGRALSAPHASRTTSALAAEAAALVRAPASSERVGELAGLVGFDDAHPAPLSGRAQRGTAPAGRPGPRAGARSARCCCWTSRSARSIRSSARICRPSCGALFARLGKTVVLVTHDIREAARPRHDHHPAAPPGASCSRAPSRTWPRAAGRARSSPSSSKRPDAVRAARPSG